MPQNGRCLEQGIVRRQAAVRPNFKNELVVVGALTDTSVFDRILDARDRRKNRIDRDETDRLIGTFIFLGGSKTATDTNIELGVKLMFPVQSATDLFG